MKKNVAGQKVRLSLFSGADRIANPTIALGDVKVDLDGAGQANVNATPTSDAAGLVTWSPIQAETNADVVTLLFNDAAGAEWDAVTLVIYTEDSTSIAAILLDTGTTLDGKIDTIDTNVDAILADTGTDGVLLAATATSAALVDDVWGEALPASYTAGEAGYILGNMSNITVTFSGPVVDDDTIELYQADDYYDADDRRLEWTDSGSTWPDITGATVMLYVRAADGTQFSAAGTVLIDGGGAGQSVGVELSSAQTTTLINTPQPSTFRVRVTLASGHKVTLVSGTLTAAYDIA